MLLVVCALTNDRIFARKINAGARIDAMFEQTPCHHAKVKINTGGD